MHNLNLDTLGTPSQKKDIGIESFFAFVSLQFSTVNFAEKKHLVFTGFTWDIGNSA